MRMSQVKERRAAPGAAAMVTRFRAGVMTPAISTVSEKISGNGTLRGRGEMNKERRVLQQGRKGEGGNQHRGHRLRADRAEGDVVRGDAEARSAMKTRHRRHGEPGQAGGLTRYIE